MKAFYMKDQSGTGSSFLRDDPVPITLKDTEQPGPLALQAPEETKPDPAPDPAGEETPILYTPGSRRYPASVVKQPVTDPNARYKPGSGLITVLPSEDQDKLWKHIPGTQRFNASTRKREIGGWV